MNHVLFQFWVAVVVRVLRQAHLTVPKGKNNEYFNLKKLFFFAFNKF